MKRAKMIDIRLLGSSTLLLISAALHLQIALLTNAFVSRPTTTTTTQKNAFTKNLSKQQEPYQFAFQRPFGYETHSYFPLHVSRGIEGGGKMGSEEDGKGGGGGEDWRSFRAKLVSNELRSSETKSSDGGKNNDIHQHQHHDNNDGGDFHHLPHEEHTGIDFGFDFDHFIGDEDKHNDGSQDVSSSTKSSSSSSSWIYDAGTNIETGTLLLNNPNPQKWSHDADYALSKQFLHKSVIIILEHDHRSASANGVTTGLILNRPTDLQLCQKSKSSPKENDNDDDQCNSTSHPPTADWNVWFGGHEHGLHTGQPKFYCLHSLTDTPEAVDLSDKIMENLYFCSLQDARNLVQNDNDQANANTNAIQPHDFWCFSGIVTWKSSKLIQEIKNGSWYAAAMDASVIQKGLKNNGNDNGGSTILLQEDVDADTRNERQRANSENIWKLFMQWMGNDDEDKASLSSSSSSSSSDSIGDDMLRQWSRQHLIFDAPPMFAQNDAEEDTTKMTHHPQITIKPGMMVRSAPPAPIAASSQDSSSSHQKRRQQQHHFLLSNQYFHKSTILILQNDDEMTVGVMLNMPSSKTIDVTFYEQSSIFSDESTVHLPLRYGGPLGGICVTDQEHYLGGNDHEPMLCLHWNAMLRHERVGEPICSIGCGSDDDDDDVAAADDDGGIWKCSLEDARDAIREGIAMAQDFIVVDGICVWSNEEEENEDRATIIHSGLAKDIREGIFDIVSEEDGRMDEIWNSLTAQETLTPSTLERNIIRSEEAWALGGGEPLLQVVEGSDNDNVSTSTIESLKDRALHRWMKTFLIF